MRDNALLTFVSRFADLRQQILKALFGTIDKGYKQIRSRVWSEKIVACQVQLMPGIVTQHKALQGPADGNHGVVLVETTSLKACPDNRSP